MEDSILISTKKVLGLAEDYTAFDSDVTLHINSGLSILNQLGLISSEKSSILGSESKWEELGLSIEVENLVKSYIFLKARLVFDPPPTSFALTAAKEQVSEMEARLSMYREIDFKKGLI